MTLNKQQFGDDDRDLFEGHAAGDITVFPSKGMANVGRSMLPVVGGAHWGRDRTTRIHVPMENGAAAFISHAPDLGYRAGLPGEVFGEHVETTDWSDTPDDAVSAVRRWSTAPGPKSQPRLFSTNEWTWFDKHDETI